MYSVMLTCIVWCSYATHSVLITRTSVVSERKVWFQHARVWFIHAEFDFNTKKCDFYTQSAISKRRVRFLPTECNFHTHSVMFTCMDVGCSVGGVALLHTGHKTGLMCTTVLSLMSQSLIFVFVLGSRTEQFLCCMYLVKIVWSYRHYSYSCFLSINWLMSASLTPTITVTSDLFWVRLSLQWLMSVKLNRPPKPEESQKDSIFNGKTIPYPGFEPGTSGLAVGSHNRCTSWVGGFTRIAWYSHV
jgi:hypothetical protein